jgi:ketosteroid isomerase-like protein
MRTTAADIALEFIDRINSHDIPLLAEMITEDHLFIDAQGNQVRGRQPLERSWRACFEWFPDYSVQVDQAFANGNIAVVTGWAMGTYSVHGRLTPRIAGELPPPGKPSSATSASPNGASTPTTSRYGR